MVKQEIYASPLHKDKSVFNFSLCTSVYYGNVWKMFPTAGIFVSGKQNIIVQLLVQRTEKVAI